MTKKVALVALEQVKELVKAIVEKSWLRMVLQLLL